MDSEAMSGELPDRGRPYDRLPAARPRTVSATFVDLMRKYGASPRLLRDLEGVTRASESSVQTEQEPDEPGWGPATDVEVAMRDALRGNDQDSYFRILAGVDLLLPVSADALAGRAPLGWGTWSTGGRTHVLAFTSTEALHSCLSDYTGATRRVPYAQLADTWPNLEWWLAVNPGLPIEGYLPAWFVAQLGRGDFRMPTRGPVHDSRGAEEAAERLLADRPRPRAGGRSTTVRSIAHIESRRR